MPGSSDNAWITNSGTYTVTLNSSVSLASLTLGGTSGTQALTNSSGTLTLNGASTVSAHGLFANIGGNLAGTGSLVANGPMIWTSGTISGSGSVTAAGGLTLTSGGGKTLSGRMFINSAAAVWDGGTILINSSAIFSNAVGGTFDCGGDNPIIGDGTTLFANAGLLRKTAGTATSSIGMAFNCAGSLDVQSGTLNLTGGGTNTGSLNASAGGTLALGGGTHYFNAGCSVTGPGIFSVTSGTANMAGTLSVTGTNTFGGGTLNFSNTVSITGSTLNISGATVNFNGATAITPTTLNLISGTLGGTNVVTVGGAMTWNGGTFSGSGAVTANGGLTMTTGSGKTLSGRTLVNNAQAVWSNGSFSLSGGAVVSNSSTGTFDCAFDGSIVDDGTTWFVNAGLFRKTNGAGSTTLSLPFNCAATGSVDVQTGTISLNSGGTNAGHLNASAGGTLNLGGGTHYFNAGSSVTGPGTFSVTSGTANMAGTLSVTGTNSFVSGTVSCSNTVSISGSTLNLSGSIVNFNGATAITPAILNLNGGTLGGTNIVTVSGAMTWNSATISGSGAVNANGGLTINGGGTKTLSGRALINSAQAVWSNGTVTVNSGAIISNAATGTFDCAVDGAINGDGTTFFANAGLFRKTNGTGIGATINMPFNSTGSVNAQVGTLILNSGGTNTGALAVSSGSTLQFSGATSYLNAGSSLTGAGTVVISTTVNVAGAFSVVGTNIINSGGSLNASNSAGIVIASLNLAGGILSGNGPVSITNSLNWTGGTISGSSPVNVTGATAISGGGGKTLTGRTLINSGPAVWSNGSIAVNSGAVLSNAVGGTFDCASDNSINGDGTTVLANAGLFRKTGGTGTTAVNIPFNCSGSVDVQSGTLSFANGGTNTGVLNASPSGTLNLGGGTNYLMAGSSVTGPGTFSVSSGTANIAGSLNVTGTNTFSGGTANFTGNYSISGGTLNISFGTVNFNGTGVITPAQLNLTGGILGGTNDVTVSAPMTWNGGTITGSGSVNAGGGLTISTGAGKNLIGRTLNNSSQATWSGGNITMNSGATLSNCFGGTLDCASDASINGDATTLFANAGLFRKTAGTGTTTVSLAFNCAGSGVVDAQSGTLSLVGGGTDTGNLNASVGGILSLNGGTHYLNPGSSVTGGGTFAVGSGTANLAGSLNVTGTNSFNGGTANFTGSYSISGGTLNITGGAVNLNGNGIITPANLNLVGGTLAGTNDVTVSAPMNWNGGTIGGSGSVNAAGGLTINTGASRTLTGRILNNTAQATWTNGTISTGGGSVISNAPGGTFDIAADVNTIAGGGSHVIFNAGLFRKTGGTNTCTLTDTFTNTGTVEIQSGTLNPSGLFVQTAGLTLLDGGNLSVSSPFQLQGGTLAGGGRITGSVTNNGVVSPGWTNGSLNITANYIQTTNGALNIAVGGTAPGAGFSQLNVASAATLAGALTVLLTNSFVPVPGASFLFLTNASRAGIFTNLSSPSGAIWQTNYTATNLTLISVGQIVWTAPADITYGAALGAGQLSATTTPSVAGSFAYNPVSGTVLNSGAGRLLTATFTPATSGYVPASLQVPINVLKAPLGITATNQTKTYGQNVGFAGTEFAASGLVNGDVVTSVSLASDGGISNAPVNGSPYLITITNALGDAGLTNYIITCTNGALTVNPAPLGITANSRGKTYGQNITFTGTEFVSSPLQNNETMGTVTLASAGAISNAPVSGSPYPIAASAPTGGTFSTGNYAITFTNGTLTVAHAAVSIASGITAGSKIYDRTTAAALSSNLVVLAGVVNNDNITLNTNGYTATFASSSVAAGIAVTINGMSLSGAAAGNYILTQPGPLSANITRAPVSVSSGITANNKTYDRTTVATLSSNIVLLAGVINPDVVTLNTNGYTAAFASSNVANGITVTVTGMSLSDASAGNYILTQPGPLFANITRAPVSVSSGITANSKFYDHTTVATLSSNNALLAGVINPDVVTLNTNGCTANFASFGVGTDIGVTASGLTLGGAAAGNYSLTQPTGLTASILIPSLRVTPSLPNVVLSWTTNAGYFALKQTTNLAPPINWTTISSGIVVSGTNNTFTTNAAHGNQLFDLIAP